MRHGTYLHGRFDTDYEHAAIIDGIDIDLQKFVGQTIDWWRWDPEATEVDPVYDVGGRVWKEPLKIPTVMAIIIQGAVRQNDRGYYNTDTLRVTINIKDVDEQLTDMLSGALNDYLLDRIVYRDEVFVPTKIYPRGIVGTNYTMLTFDADQVNSEQLVNDPQFLQYAGISGARLGYGEETYGDGLYGL
jgi:hypothetical protein